MGTRTYTEKFDDFDETASDDVVTIPFSLEGISYSIDLNESNLTALREALEPYIAVARKTGGRKVTKTKTQIEASNKEIRDWARSQGIEVPARGVIPASVKAAFAAA